MPKPSSRISGIVPSGKDGWEVHFAAWNRKQAGEPIIMLSVGDHDFDTPSETVEACVTAVRAGHHHYTQLPGMPRLREAMARISTRCTGVETTVGEVIATPGGQLALYAAVQGMLDPGDHAIVVAPYYATYPGTFRAAGADFTVVEAEATDGFQPRAEAIEAALKPNTRGDPHQHAEQPDRRGLFARKPRRHRRTLRASTICGCSPTRSTGRSAAASTSRRAPCPAWRSARWSSTRCRRATA